MRRHTLASILHTVWPLAVLAVIGSAMIIAALR